MTNKVYIENRPHYLLPGAFPAQIYEERCLTQINDGDVVVTSRPVNRAFYRYMTEHLGIGRCAHLVNPSVYKRDLAYSVLKDPRLLALLKDFAASRDYVLETYISSPHLEEVALITGLPLLFQQHIYEKYSSKSGFRRLAAYLNIPVPRGIETGKFSMLPAQKFFDKHKDVVVKYDHTLGGSGVFRASSVGEMNQIIRNALENHIIIEEFIDAAVHGSVQIIIKEGGCRFIVDECFQQGTSFKGFCYPPRFDSAPVLDYVRPLANLLMDEGVASGWFGLDFMVTYGGEIFFHDFNPRKTAVSYVLSTLGAVFNWTDGMPAAGVAAAYVALTTVLSFEDIYELLGDLLVRPGNGHVEGIIILNPGLLPQGLVNVAAVSQSFAHHNILLQAVEALTRKAEQSLLRY